MSPQIHMSTTLNPHVTVLEIGLLGGNTVTLDREDGFMEGQLSEGTVRCQCARQDESYLHNPRCRHQSADSQPPGP